MKVCIDTNAYSDLRKGNQHLQALLDECDEKSGARVISYDRHFDLVGGLIRLAP